MLVFIDLVQDIDVLLPVLDALKGDAELQARVVVSRWLARESPRTEALLRRHSIPFAWVKRREVAAGRAPRLDGVGALLTASESSHPAHVAGHVLAARARAAGALTCTLQHGLENVGLRGPDADRWFGSQIVFCWFPPAATPPETPLETLPKLRHVGRPRLPPAWEAPSELVYQVGVFENLHSDRYGDSDRRRFFEGLDALGKAGVRALVRPHPAGGGDDALALVAGAWPNLVLESSRELRRRPDGVLEAILQCRRVITTPSTAALDAASLGRPVALALSGGATYAGLPLLRTPVDWQIFAASSPDSSKFAAFAAAHVAPGEAAGRLIEQIKLELRGGLGEAG